MYGGESREGACLLSRTSVGDQCQYIGPGALRKVEWRHCDLSRPVLVTRVEES